MAEIDERIREFLAAQQAGTAEPDPMADDPALDDQPVSLSE
jgi:hypothetical protein